MRDLDEIISTNTKATADAFIALGILKDAARAVVKNATYLEGGIVAVPRDYFIQLVNAVE